MITAKEARDLAGPTFEERVEEQLELVYEQIKTAAEKKNRKTLLTSDFWTRGGYNNSNEYKAAVKKLEELGYTVKFFYEEYQFVNMYTIVEW